MIVADHSADPSVLSCDVLGQAEHGPTSPAILATTSEEVGLATIREVDGWLESWPTAHIAGVAWRDFASAEAGAITGVDLNVNAVVVM
jgi:sulfopropanediol 3-dehydrogenase